MRLQSDSMILVLVVLLLPPAAAACPQIEGLVDFNCDEKSKIVITGDSVVQGIGDSRNSNFGGYPKRLRKRLPQSRIVNNGISGLTARDLFERFRFSSFTRRSRNADLVLIDVGRNDCRDRLPANYTVQEIRRLVGYLRRRIGGRVQSPPYVVVATQIPNRELRRSCIETLNRALLQKRSNKLPVKFRLDRMNPSILSSDGLHPDDSGYSRIAKRTARFLKRRAVKLQLKRRKDRDGDGVYDYFERKRFSTDPTLADTDGDTLLDGEEIFNLNTDPLVPQS